MMNHHPHALCRYSVASLITGQVGHFWKADPGHFSKVPKGDWPGMSKCSRISFPQRRWFEDLCCAPFIGWTLALVVDRSQRRESSDEKLA